MSLQSLEKRLDGIRANRPNDENLAKEAVELAAEWLEDAGRGMRRTERRQAAQLARMMNDPSGKALTFALADQVFRPPSEQRSASRFRDLIDDYGVPHYLPMHERVGMKLGAMASAAAPELVMPMVTAKLRGESESVILPGEDARLRPHLDARRNAGMKMNLNQLGEAILGEDEAEKRMTAVIARISSPDCDYLSVKISAIFSQIHLVAFSETVTKLKERLRRLYRAAISHPAKDAKGSRPKFLNLDMEEYRDLHLTWTAFREVLMEPEFFHLEAGIVLQAYLPDSWPVQKQLNEWAKARVAAGGAQIKIRIVKGANLAMEKVESELHDWPQAPYTSKEEVDANFKRMLHEGCKPENAKYVRIGLASHNLFDLAYAMLLRTREGVEDRVEFEMLEGMANHQARVVNDAAGGLLLYAPVVSRDDFHSAIAYLVRRLDENTAEENFLRDLFGMVPGDASWGIQRDRFLRACSRKDTVAFGPRRVQNRATEQLQAPAADAPFHNTPDTDWALPHNVAWIRSKVEAMRDAPLPVVPLCIGGVEIPGESEGIGKDPSRPGVTAYRYAQAGAGLVENALQTAVSARASWQALGYEGRAKLMRAAGAEIARQRGKIIATMVMDAGKAVFEGDVEISEAIDFANYYADSFSDPAFHDGSAFQPYGTIVVTPPWNFPFAIPCGGVLAALMSGNTVIIKPARETILTGWVLANCLWDAGIPREVLQFVVCGSGEVGRKLVSDERVGGVILTGAWETARMFLGWKPEMRLFAETSGKDALIITAAADPDQAVKDLVKSAFGHSGQKCSAASLAIIEAEVYDNPSFRRQLRDAAASLTVGPSWKYDSIVTPIIREAGDDLLRGLTQLDSGEEWLLEPRQDPANPCQWSPGIRIGVAPGSWFHRTECFGPVLGLMRADDLDHAIRLQNQSSFGLTGGIHSLDPREIETWREKVEVGNAYINRPITGAIVRRQPFGGWKHSSFGPGAKAGGPNYCALFGVWQNTGLPTAKGRPERAAKLLQKLTQALPDSATTLRAAASSDAATWAKECSVDHDPSGLTCESNIFRYRPFPRAWVRAGSVCGDLELARTLLAASACGVSVDVSVSISHPWLASAGIVATVEDDAAFAKRVATAGGDYGVLRAPGADPELKAAATEAGIRIVDHPVVWNGRLEMLWPLREQSVSETLHRYGNIVPPGKNQKLVRNHS